MCRLANVLMGKTMLCCRDSIFLSEALDFSILETDKFYVDNLVLENRFDRFCYLDYKNYVGRKCDDNVVVLKGFAHKNVPRFQIDLLKGLFFDYFECDGVDFNFWVSFDRILKSFSCNDVKRFTFAYSGPTNARHFYYNRLEDDLFVFSDETESCSLDKNDPHNNSSSSSTKSRFRTINRCYNICFNDYLKCAMRGIIENKIVSSVLKEVDDSVLDVPFRRYCAFFMNANGSNNSTTPNVMGSTIYSSERLWATYGAIDFDCAL